MNNQIVKTPAFEGQISVRTDDGFVCLTELLNYAHAKTGTRLNMTKLFSTDNYEDYAAIVAREQGIPRDSLIKQEGRAAKAKTWCHVYIAVWIALKLSPEFQYRVIDEFITNNLALHRNLGGDLSKELQEMVTNKIAIPTGRSPKGTAIQLSVQIKRRMTELAEYNSWNEADAALQQARVKLQDKLIEVIDLGYVASLSDLWTAVQKLKV